MFALLQKLPLLIFNNLCGMKLVSIKFKFLNKLSIRFILFGLLTSVAFNTIVAHDKMFRIKVYPPDNAYERAELLGLLEIDHYNMVDGGIVSEIPEHTAEILKSLPYKYEILCNDIEAELKKINDKYYASLDTSRSKSQRVAIENSGDAIDNIIAKPTDFKVKTSLGGYYSFAEMVTAMNDLVSDYPSIAKKFSIGKTVEGRDIWCVKISDNVNSDETGEPELLYMGLQHAREAIGGASMIFLMQYLCENYSKDINIKSLVDNRAFYIIPCMNADGWEYNRVQSPNGGGGWRKNRKKYSTNYGVDLNRNWSVMWGNCSAPISGPAGNCGSNNSASETYYGPSAFSEPETEAVRKFSKTRNFKIFLDQHAYGPYYSIPPGRQTDPLPADDLKFYVELCANMGKYNGMKYGNSYQALAYEVAGGVKDWMYKGEIGQGSKAKVYGFTGEGGAGGGSGGSFGSFWPPAAQIINLCKGMTYQNLQMAYTAGSYVDHQDLGDINVTSKTGNFPFRLRRLGLDNKPVKVSIIPLQNIIGVGSAVTKSLATFNDIYDSNITYTLPTEINNGNVIKYVWKVETEACIFYDTIVKVYNGTSILSDNMEGSSAATNWTLNPTTGAWGYATDFAFSGSKSFAESPGAKYGTATATKTATYKNTFNLNTVGSAYLSFMIRGRAENFADKLQVQISTNGSSWTAIPGKTTIQEPGTLDGSTINGEPSLTGIHEEWFREIFDLNNYIGLKNLYLRLSFTSSSTDANYVFNTDDGFNIDDLKLIGGSNPSISVLPLELISFTGRNNNDINILNWSTASEINTKNFEIQRSTNAIEYETIGSVNAAGNSNTVKDYGFTDINPYKGNNIYRLKMIDIDGSFTYSKLISLKVQEQDGITLIPTGIDKIYPNPTNGSLHVNFNVTEEEAQFTYRIFNNIGEILKSDVLNLSTGLHAIDIDASDYAKGQYYISFTNALKKTSYEGKFVKQ